MGKFRYHGDTNAGPSYRKYGWDLLAINHQTMRNLGIDQAQSTKRLDDGVTIKALSQMFMDTVDIYVPEVVQEDIKPEKVVHIPGCVARYEFTVTSGNDITRGPFAGTGILGGGDVAILNLQEESPIKQPFLLNSGLQRNLNRWIALGTSSSKAKNESGIVPKKGGYTISMAVKIKERLNFPYWDEIYERLVPVKPWIVLYQGSNWIRVAGGFTPLMGYCFPQAASVFDDTVNYFGTVITDPFEEEPKIVDHSDFPMPWGLWLGCKFNGLLLYGGNRILAGKQSNWENDKGNQPLLSDPLEYEKYYHVVMSFDDKTEQLRMLISNKVEDRVVYRYSETYCRDIEMQPHSDAETYDDDVWIDGEHPTLVGYWQCGLSHGFKGFSYGDEWFTYGDFFIQQMSNIEIVLPRIYHRGLLKDEMYHLSNEVFLGTFVVDDEELQLAQGAGYDVFSFPGEMIE